MYIASVSALAGFQDALETPEAVVSPYAPETVGNFELGFKSEWLDNRMRINASLYLHGSIRISRKNLAFQ